jgi:hypothetical protein
MIREREFRQRDDQRNGIYGEGRSEKGNLGRGTIREMEFMEGDDQRNGIYGEGQAEKWNLWRGTARERDYYGEGRSEKASLGVFS